MLRKVTAHLSNQGWNYEKQIQVWVQIQDLKWNQTIQYLQLCRKLEMPLKKWKRKVHGVKSFFLTIIYDYRNITWLVVPSMKQRIIWQFPYELGMGKKNSDMSHCYWNARTSSTKEKICSQNYLRTRNMSYSTKCTKETWSGAESSQIKH